MRTASSYVSSSYNHITSGMQQLSVQYSSVWCRTVVDCCPHMPIGKVWIYRLLFVCLLACTVTDFSAEIKLAASNFARRFIGVQGRKSPIFVNFAPSEAQNRTNRPARHHLHDVRNDYRLAPKHMTVTKDMLSDYIIVEMRRRKRHASA